MHIGLTKSKSNYPQKSKSTSSLTTSAQFPTDLMAEDRQFYSEFIFMEYSYKQQLTATPILRPIGGQFGSVWLPVPRKINDVQVLNWEAVSASSQLAQGIKNSVASTDGGRRRDIFNRFLGNVYQAAGGAALSALGVAVNPFLFMQFQSTSYKKHQLQWVLAPSNEMETRSLKTIIDKFRYYSLPEANATTGSLFLNYPSILFVKLYPDDQFTMKFRPCIIEDVQVDYTAAGVPSFFKNTGAPTVVSLTISLKEIQLWDKTNFDGKEGVGLQDTLNEWNDLIGSSANTFNEFRSSASSYVKDKLGVQK